MYQQANQEGAAGAGPEAGAQEEAKPQDEDVVDADFEVVKSDK